MKIWSFFFFTAALTLSGVTQARLLCSDILRSVSEDELVLNRAVKKLNSLSKDQIFQLESKMDELNIPVRLSEDLKSKSLQSKPFRRKLLSALTQFQKQNLESSDLIKRIESLLKTWGEFFSRERAVLTELIYDKSEASSPVLNDNIQSYYHTHDVLVRKVAQPEDEFQINEVDLALALKKVPNRRAVFSKSNEISFTDEMGSEKVFSIGFEGARDFQGKYTHREDGNRYYAILLPKGFLSKFTVDLSGVNLSKKLFYLEHGLFGRAFYIKRETSTKQYGQLHVQQGRDWANYILDDDIVAPNQVINKYLLHTLELNQDGSIINVRNP